MVIGDISGRSAKDKDKNKRIPPQLTRFLPEGWKELVVDHNSYLAITVQGRIVDQSEFNEICFKISNYFGGRLIEIKSVSKNGLYFIVYLKKEIK